MTYKVFARLNETSIICSLICRRHFRELTGRGYLFFKVASLCTVFETAERFHPRGQQLCKFTGTKEGFYIRKRFNSHKTGLEKQHGHCFIVLGYQYGHRDVMWKRSIGGLHGTSRQPCWWSRSISLLCKLNSVFMSILREKILPYWPPTWPPCHVAANQEYYLRVFSSWFPPTYCDWRSSVEADHIVAGKTGLSLWLLKSSSLVLSVMRYHKTGLEDSDQADLKTQESNTWGSLRGFLVYGISLIWSPGFGISLICSPGSGISLIWGPAYGISLIWKPGFGILKQIGGEIRDWKYAGVVRCRK